MNDRRDDDPARLRARIREGWDGLTTGLAPGFLQGNLVVLPGDWAEEFEAFCRANAQACPLLGRTARGEPHLPTLGADLDLRTDVGRYVVYRDGVRTVERADLLAIWQPDWVGFVLGCWFSNEAAIAQAGIRMRHVELEIQGGLFRTTRPARPIGRFRCNVIASMRPFAKGDVERVAAITAAAPLAHGAPIHIGEPVVLGIADLAKPDFGEPLPPEPGEVPMYWGCGLTPIAAIEAARPPIAIVHAPGRMVVTDLPA